MNVNPRSVWCAAALWMAAACADEWPQFRGPNRDGKSAETGLLKTWPAGGPKKLWTARGCGQGFSSVAVAGGRVFTLGVKNGQVCAVAFDLDGKKQWETVVGPAYDPRRGKEARSYRGYFGTRSTPTYDAGRLYVETPMGDVARLDAKTGNVEWKVDLFQRFDAHNSLWAMSESPLVVDGKVIVQPAGAAAGVAALDKDTGKTVWKSAGVDHAPGYASPVAVTHNGRGLVLVMTSQHAAGVDLKTGRLLWKYYWKNRWEVNADNPIYDRGCVFITSGYRLGSALLQLNRDGSKATEVWRSQTLDNHHGGAVLVGGYVYSCNSRGQWICLDFMTGEVKYKTRSRNKGSCVYADGMLYCLTERGGRVLLVPATPREWRAVSSFSIPGAASDRRVWAHPAISDGRLYIRRQNELHAYDIRAK